MNVPTIDSYVAVKPDASTLLALTIVNVTTTLHSTRAALPVKDRLLARTTRSALETPFVALKGLVFVLSQTLDQTAKVRPMKSLLWLMVKLN